MACQNKVFPYLSCCDRPLVSLLHSVLCYPVYCIRSSLSSLLHSVLACFCFFLLASFFLLLSSVRGWALIPALATSVTCERGVALTY